MSATAFRSALTAGLLGLVTSAWGGPALESGSPQGRAVPSPPPEGVKKAWGGPALSSEPTRIDFVAIDRDTRERAAEAGRAGACRIGLQAVWAKTRMRVPEHPPGEVFPLPTLPGAHLDDGLGGAVQFDCRIDEDWRGGIAWRQGRAGVDGLSADRAVSVEATFSGAEAVLSRRLLRPATGPSLDALVALGWYRSRYRESVDGSQHLSADHAPGVRLGLEASWRIRGSVEFFVRAERVWLDFGRGRDGARDPDGTVAGPRVDFGGPAISAGARWLLR